MNRITRIREGFISLNKQVDNLYQSLLKLSADLVGESMEARKISEGPANVGIFGAILDWQENLSRRIERVHNQVDILRSEISLQTVEYDKPSSPDISDAEIEYALAMGQRGATSLQTTTATVPGVVSNA